MPPELRTSYAFARDHDKPPMGGAHGPLFHPSSTCIVPTQFKATQLVVAIAVWANAISARGAHPNLSILLLNDASEQYYITIG